MKTNFFTAIAIIFIQGFALLASAHASGLYGIPKLPDAEAIDLHDGSLDDWTSLFSEPTFTQDDFTPVDPDVTTPVDPTFEVYMAWSEADQRIYVAIKRTDDVYINNYAGGDPHGMWGNDGIEVMLDADHTGGWFSDFSPEQYSEEEIMRLDNAQAQQFLAVPESPDGRNVGYMGAGLAWVNEAPYAEAGGADNGDHRVIEMALPLWDDLDYQDPDASQRGLLEAGKIIGFQIAMRDFDIEDMNPLSSGSYFNLNGLPDGWRNADTFVDGYLLDVGEEDTECCEVNPVPTESAVLVGPINNAAVSGPTVTLEWDPVAGADLFGVWVSDGAASGNAALLDTVVAGTLSAQGTITYAVTDLACATCHWWIQGVNANGAGSWSDKGSYTVQGAAKTVAAPQGFALQPNYPNPFNPDTQINYQLPEAGAVTLEVYNAMGQKIRVLEQAYRPAGLHQVNWDGRNDQGHIVAGGVYLYRLTAGTFSQTRRMLFLK